MADENVEDGDFSRPSRTYHSYTAILLLLAELCKLSLFLPIVDRPHDHNDHNHDEDRDSLDPLDGWIDIGMGRTKRLGIIRCPVK